jgi:hypothetical protein
VKTWNKNVELKICRKTETSLSRLKGCHITKYQLCFEKFRGGVWVGWGGGGGKCHSKDRLQQSKNTC